MIGSRNIIAITIVGGIMKIMKIAIIHTTMNNTTIKNDKSHSFILYTYIQLAYCLLCNYYYSRKVH